MSKLLYAYSNGGYDVEIHSDGTKIRKVLDSSVPPAHPEQMDLKITNWCDAGCFWCHEKSTKRGQHGDVDGMLSLLQDLPPGVEIAIGGGDPLSHPEFERLVRGLRGFGLIPNVTINGRHLERHRRPLEKLISEQLVFGVGVSLHEKLPDWDYEHMVIHMIAGVDDPAILDDTARKKLLILGYKDFGRGVKFRGKNADKVDANLAQWGRELLWIAKEHHVSYDTLAIKLLDPSRIFRRYETFEQSFMGDEGHFSMYVDGVAQEFAVSSYSPDRYKWTTINGMFGDVRRLAQASS